MRSPWVSAGSVMLAAAVTAGALGAHLLQGRLDARSLALWETAVRYLVVGGLGLLVAGLAAGSSARVDWLLARVGLLVGAVVFSGSLAGLALGGPRWLGAITPAGGLLLIGGFVAMAVAAARR